MHFLFALSMSEKIIAGLFVVLCGFLSYVIWDLYQVLLNRDEIIGNHDNKVSGLKEEIESWRRESAKWKTHVEVLWVEKRQHEEERARLNGKTQQEHDDLEAFINHELSLLDKLYAQMQRAGTQEEKEATRNHLMQRAMQVTSNMQQAKEQAKK